MSLEKVKELLSSGDYDTIDKGIIMAVDMDDRKVFEGLLEGCEIGWTIEGGYEHSGAGGGKRPVLNGWLKKLQIQNGSLIDNPTGYYVFLSLITHNQVNANVHESLKFENITHLSLKKCNLKFLPKKMSRLTELKILDISFNPKLKESKSDLTSLKKLEYIIDHETYLDHGFNSKFSLEINDISSECIGCNEHFDSERDMVMRYDGNFCQNCDESWNDLHFYCFCCNDWIAPIINDFKIDFEAKTAENDTLFSEEYDCPEEYSTKALFVDSSIIFKTICSYCEADSRPTDEEFAYFVSRVDSGELSIETIKDNDNFQSEETGISEKQYDMVSKFFD
tara:strand:- start:87 stop:1094 length:1008 start_codon:yes stop_codon:yes gene_type:complete